MELLTNIVCGKYRKNTSVYLFNNWLDLSCMINVANELLYICIYSKIKIYEKLAYVMYLKANWVEFHERSCVLKYLIWLSPYMSLTRGFVVLTNIVYLYASMHPICSPMYLNGYIMTDITNTQYLIMYESKSKHVPTSKYLLYLKTPE